MDDLADKIVQAGVKRVEGNLIGDESYFLGNPIPGSWEYDDLQWYYGAEISALPLNDNALDLSVLPGPIGYPCTVKVASPSPRSREISECRELGSINILDLRKMTDGRWRLKESVSC